MMNCGDRQRFRSTPSDIRSLPFYQMMTNDERAVWHGLRLALWCCDELPVDYPTLARVLMMSREDVLRGLTERVLSMFPRVAGKSIASIARTRHADAALDRASP